MHQSIIYILCPQSQDSADNGDSSEQRLEFRAYFAALDHTMNTLDLFSDQQEWEAASAPLWSISMPMVIAIEPVSYAANGYPWSQWECNFIWQMVVQEGSGDLNACLRRRAYYCSVQTKEDYQVWLSALKSACSRNCSWLTRHHPGIYLATSGPEPASSWTCCQQEHEAQSGCSLTSIVGLETDGILHRNQAKLDPVVMYRGFKTLVTKSSSLSQFGIKAATFKAGDVFYVQDTSPSASDENLWLVVQEESADMRRLLPRGIFDLCDIRRENWFFQEIPHDIACMLLQTQPAGSFLIRSYKQRLMVSYVSNDLIEHRWIHQNESSCYYLEETKAFSSVQELVHHYSALNRQNKNPLFRFYVPQQNLEKIWAVELREFEINSDSHADLVASLASGCQFNAVSCIFTEKRLASLVCSAADATTSQIGLQRSGDKLWNEARILMCLEHENLCKLVGVVLASPTNGANSAHLSAIVVEHFLSPRENLSEFVKAEKEPLLADPNALFQITYQLCTGMAYLQRKGIVHNALALENCFLVSNNRQMKVRIGGFHHAQFEDQVVDSEQDLHQSYTSILALPPPELVHRRAPPSNRSDVWSFGVLLWKLFTFGGGPNAKNLSVNKILRHNWNSELPPDVAQFIEKVIRMCLVDVPDLRVTFQDLWRIFKSAISQTENENGLEHQSNDMSPSTSSSGTFNNMLSAAERVKKAKRKKQRSRLHLQPEMAVPTSAETAPKYRSPFTPALPLLNGHVLGDEDDCAQVFDDDTRRSHREADTKSQRTLAGSGATDSEAYSGTDQLSASSSEPRNVGSISKSLRFQLMKEKHEKRKIFNELKQCKAKCIEYIEQLREQYQTKIESLEMQLTESETIRKQLLKDKGALQKTVDDKIRAAENKSAQAQTVVNDLQRQLHQLATNNADITQTCEALKVENKALSDRNIKADRVVAEMQNKLLERQRIIDGLEQKLRLYDSKFASGVGNGNSGNDDQLVISMPINGSVNSANFVQSSASSGSSVIRGSVTSDSGISTNSSIGIPKRTIMMSCAPGGVTSSPANGKTAIVKMHQQAAMQQVTPSRMGYRQTHNVRQVGIVPTPQQHNPITPSISQQSLLSAYGPAHAAPPMQLASKPNRSADAHRSMQELAGSQQFAPVPKSPGFISGSTNTNPTNLNNTSSGSVQTLVQRDAIVSTPRPEQYASGSTQTNATFAIV